MSTLLKNALIVDGSGADRMMGDIRIVDGIIAQVGSLLETADDRVIDCTGLVAVPGFIEIHTHYDPQLCWDAYATPALEHGVTSVICGNCSISLAPIACGSGETIARWYERIEDIGADVFQSGVPFSWTSHEEYLDFVKKQGLGINVASAVGHSTLRRFVMGESASERRATPSEIREMGDVLEECIRGGAFGLSMAFDHIHDHRDAPVPSAMACEEERIALAKRVKACGRLYLQCSVNPLVPDKRIEQFKALARIAGASGVTCSALGVMQNPLAPEEWRNDLRLINDLRPSQGRLVAESQTRPLDLSFSLSRTWLLAFYMPTWSEIMLRPREQRLVRFAEATTMPRLREEAEVFRSLLEKVTVLDATSAHNKQFVGWTLPDVAKSMNVPLVDAMLKLALNDGLMTEFGFSGIIHADPNVVSEILTNVSVRVGGSDAGAHISQFCGEGDSTYLIEKFVNQEGLLRLEDAVKMITSDLARDYGIANRGMLKEGHAADIVVFDLKNIKRGPERRVKDLPADGERLIRPAEGYRHVFVNGELAWSDGCYTGALAGISL